MLPRNHSSHQCLRLEPSQSEGSAHAHLWLLKTKGFVRQLLFLYVFPAILGIKPACS